MEIRQLEYFLMVREAGSFTRAAERLYVSQPAVTNAIRGLEEELGIQLFDRSQKVAALTAEGRIFASHVEKIMHGISSTVEEIHALKNLSAGVLNLGLTPLGGIDRCAKLLSAYRKACPDIQITLLEDDAARLQQALLEDKLDLAILTAEQEAGSLTYRALPAEELVVCCSRHHAFRRRNIISLADLVEERLILLDASCLFRQHLVKLFEQVSCLPQIVFESRHVQTIKSLVAAECGITILPESLCEEDGRLATIPLEPALYLQPKAVWKTSRPLSHAAEAFVTLLAKGDSADE